MRNWLSWCLCLMVGVWASPALAQTSCTVTSSGALLSQFSDTAANGSITPANVRNVVCSTQLILAPGATVVAGAPVASPFTYAPALSGTMIVSSGKVELSRDAGATYYIVSLTGGEVPVLFGDQIRVTWFSAIVPGVVFFPSGI